MRYELTYFINDPTHWGSDANRRTERVKTKKELNVLVECVQEDKSILSAFYEDLTNGKCTPIEMPT